MKTETIDGAVENVENAGMAEKLTEAAVKAETQKAERRERVVKGLHLQPLLLEKANAGGGLTSEEKSGFHKVQGVAKGKTVYIAKKGGRVDLSGFTLDLPAVKQISEAEAKEKHFGKVRGQLDFDQADATVLSAFEAALAVLLIPDPVQEPKAAPAVEASTTVN